MFFLDCTLRDGGYYNDWDFKPDLICAYLKAMAALPVDMVEIGFRAIPQVGGKFRGGCAFCPDTFIRSMNIDKHGLRLAVMVNGSDLANYEKGVTAAVDRLFGPTEASPVTMVRIACHVHQVTKVMPAVDRLHELGYLTTVNLMQIAGLSDEEMAGLAESCSPYPIDVLYFADSLGSMAPEDVSKTVASLRTHWQGALGFHAHNNTETALANCLRAMEAGVSWIDATVLGMGRGPGNTRSEDLAIELQSRQVREMNLIPMLDLIDQYFRPMKQQFGWGPNPYYYMAGKKGIHPTYIQEMIGDTRYDNEDILAVINHLSTIGGKHYRLDTLEAARNFYSDVPRGHWEPARMLEGREVLILGAGPGVREHRIALENYIRRAGPFVMALNTQSGIDPELIDVCLACHPVRLLADFEEHAQLSQPLITPASMLPEKVINGLNGKKLLDYGLGIRPDTFAFGDTYCILPKSLVVAYAWAVAASGQAKRILLAGFDGYGADDPRTREMQCLLSQYQSMAESIDLVSITPTRYKMPIQSVYSM